MIFSLNRQYRLSAIVFVILLPASFAQAQPDPHSSLIDPVLEKIPLPDYQYIQESPEAYLKNSKSYSVSVQDLIQKRQKVDELLKRNPEMPEYMKRAYRAYQQTGDKNIYRFAQAASEFQKQELREQLMQHIDDPEKMNRLISVLYGRPYAPYKAVGQSGYVINQETGEIARGSDDLSETYDRKLKADITRKQRSSRKREVSRKRSSRGNHDGEITKMFKEEYHSARKRAIETNRPDLVEELDKMARKKGLLN